ncbi:hypothetical protein [uncultured Roseibium sp.]|uniref:hypothetical protein n=1 Tax=uncultured Roseibium sp. TaxID=1936171 RepID=UPI003216345F
MASTTIADIIEPRVFTPYMQENRPEKLVMMERSGILSAPDEALASRFMSGGRKIEVPYWNDLDRNEPSIINDGDTAITPEKITADDLIAYKHRMAKAWASKSITGMVATGDARSPMEQVASRVNSYWSWVKEMHIMNIATGVIADSVANHSGDMVFDVYQDVASPAASNRISSAAVNRARLTMGDAMENLRAIGMHTPCLCHAAGRREDRLRAAFRPAVPDPDLHGNDGVLFRLLPGHHGNQFGQVHLLPLRGRRLQAYR